MIQLIFSEPIKLSEFINDKRAMFPGVYIWGFEGLDNNHPQNVIPYYVGITKDTIQNRITSHIKDIVNMNSTYLRFSEEYFNRYYRDNIPDSPIFPYLNPNKKISNWDKEWQDMISQSFYYYNDFEFVNSKNRVSTEIVEIKHKTKKKIHYPIVNIYNSENGDHNDTLIKRIRDDNFWVWFAEIKLDSPEIEKIKTKFNKTNDTVLTIFETLIKFQLKGITIGKHVGSYEILHNNEIDYSISCPSDIFKDTPNIIFNGNYYE